MFGLTSDDLFTAEELFYASQFERVIHTLSVLSRHKRFTSAGCRHVILLVNLLKKANHQEIDNYNHKYHRKIL